MTNECSSGYAPNECVLNGYYQIPQDLIEWMLGKDIEVESIGGLPLFSWEVPKRKLPRADIRWQTRRLLKNRALLWKHL